MDNQFWNAWWKGVVEDDDENRRDTITLENLERAIGDAEEREGDNKLHYFFLEVIPHEQECVR